MKGDGQVDFPETISMAGPFTKEQQHLFPLDLATGKLNPNSDLWGIAVAFYEMITGRSPFGVSPARVMASMKSFINPDYPAPRELRPECPPWLNGVLLKALSEDSYATADDFLDHLASEGA